MNDQNIINKTGLLVPHKIKYSKTIEIWRHNSDGTDQMIACHNKTNTPAIRSSDAILWTDNSAGDIPPGAYDSLNLFSNNEQDNSKRYNLDDALIEMIFDFSELETKPQISKWLKDDVSGSYNLWLKNKSLGVTSSYDSGPKHKNVIVGAWAKLVYTPSNVLSNFPYTLQHSWVGFTYLGTQTHFWFDWVKFNVDQYYPVFAPGASGSSFWWYINNGKNNEIERVVFATNYGRSGNTPVLMALQTPLYNVYENFTDFLKIKDSL